MTGVFIGMAVLLILINIYDGFKVKNCFGDNKKLYLKTALPIHIILLSIFFVIFFTRGSDASKSLPNIFRIIGFGFVTATFYMFLMFILCDFIKFVFKICKKIFYYLSSKFVHNKGDLKECEDTSSTKLGSKVSNFFSKIYARGITIIIIAFLSIFYGVYNASNIVITEYEVNMSNGKGNVDGLNIVMLSDMHLDTAIKESEIDEIIQMTNDLNPDIIFFCGDIFDEGTSDKLKQYTSDAFKNLKSKYGSYYITGNHEYYTNDNKKCIEYMKNAGINVLCEEYTLVDNRFYVVGRVDNDIRRTTGNKRANLSEVMQGIDKDYPIILLDHRPVDIKNSKENGVDLQLSGHTHAGQILPINFLSSLSNDVNYGYLKDDDYNIVVSSGCGTWGVPIRIGSNSEIVNIKIN